MSTLDQNSGFQDKEKTRTIIKVMGVGGGGNNAINHMYMQNIEGVSFVVLNTDRQQLNESPVPNRVLLGPNTTHGLGAGNVPDVARRAAEESEAEIAALFDDDTKMVFITAGMGGGTGTGAAPVVARIAHEKGVLTIGIVTIPFLFEGPKKILKALGGADEMGKYVDALLIINNQRLTEIYKDLDFTNAFGKADDTLTIAARSISDLITVKGKINLDFNDVNTTLRNGGAAIISSGYGTGERRVTRAIEDALESPLLKNRDVYGSQKILMNFYYNPNSEAPLLMDEMNEIQEFMANFDQEVDVIWGMAFDNTLEDQIKVTVLASGFNVSLDKESPVPTVQSPRREPVHADPKITDAQRLKDEYGDKAITDMTLRQLSARYIVLSPEEMDDDDVIDMIEKTPTFGRKPDFRNQIKERQQAASMDRPVEVPKATKRTSSGDSQTINFGEESF
ncbi:MAG: cell division protein FtsZ [Muribaculaceae bacterium]|nr:cell division protein FtsZ [Bacteroidales bacterium]MBQ1486282.1 cell division protein FtsZ [Muribaculaceae bacterium]MBQ1583744.1 cell division protein FtsZ [Muribaculaceae bacterium]MBR0493228.1 cell division protein FtsZ [Muribaculaceae bacterium]